MLSATHAATLLTASIDSGVSRAAGRVIPSSAANMTESQVDKVSKDFESMFVSQMLEQMFGDSEGDDAFGDSASKDVYKGLMMDAYGKEISKAGGIGIADYVKTELLKLQEVAS